MRTDSNHEVGKLINYFENFINDLNKDLTHNSKSTFQPQMRTTSQNTSNLSITLIDTLQPISTILPTINDDEDLTKTIPDRTFSEDIYDRLTYQTIINSNSSSSHEQFTQSFVKSAKRRRHVNHHTHKKRLHRPRPPTYIKELKAYLAHRESSSNDVAKISDVKKFSNVLVWLSNQTATPSFIETSASTPTPVSLMKIDHSLSITTDSVIAVTQDISQSYSGKIFSIVRYRFINQLSIVDPVPPFTDGANTSKSSSRRSFAYLTYENIRWKLNIRKEVRISSYSNCIDYNHQKNK